METYLIDNHDEAYYIWKNKHIQDLILIHIDSHKDFVLEQIDLFSINIGNYLNYAYAENIFSILIWIIPDFSYHSIEKIYEIENFSKFYKKTKSFSSYFFSESLYEHLPDMYITTLSLLKELVSSQFKGCKFLLDIDVDFLVNPDITHIYSNYHSSSFWFKPINMFNKLSFIFKNCVVTTISKSILGGYTPLLYSYIATELYEYFCFNFSNVFSYKTLFKAIKALLLHDITSAENIFLHSWNKKCVQISASIGLFYCYMIKKDVKNCKIVYEQLSELLPNYEAYYFPLQGMLANNEYEMVKNIVSYWLRIFPRSEQANLYKIKINLLCKNTSFIAYKNPILYTTDINTNYEKSYLLSDLYFHTHKYDSSIKCCEAVLNFLRHNPTPIWAGHISTYDNTRNHNIILAFLYERMALSFFHLKDYKSSKKCALFCKKIGYDSQNLNIIYEIYCD